MEISMRNSTSRSSKSSNARENKDARKTLVQQQGDVGVRDPAGFAEMKIRHLDKDAHKWRQKYKEVQRQMEADYKEIGHIDDQISRLKAKYEVVLEHLEHRTKERERVLKSLEQARALETAIMGETKNTVRKNIRDEQANMKRHAKGELQAARGFGSDRGTTFTKDQYLARSSKMKALAKSQSTLPSINQSKTMNRGVISRSANVL
mmetsp:Transcript_2015/g.2617  ORF Transcript_2015/g.2617 Transcript_2015/m.2617 type:complete len:206 (+) Transcript_2015:156-773(+)